MLKNKTFNVLFFYGRMVLCFIVFIVQGSMTFCVVIPSPCDSAAVKASFGRSLNSPTLSARGMTGCATLSAHGMTGCAGLSARGMTGCATLSAHGMTGCATLSAHGMTGCAGLSARGMKIQYCHALRVCKHSRLGVCCTYREEMPKLLSAA